MKCESCHLENATRAIKGEKNGRPCELFVCDNCAKPKKENPKSQVQLSLADILFSLGFAAHGENKARGETEDANNENKSLDTCPGCGLARDTLREQRRFGCPACYSAFEEELKIFLREIQFDDSHRGRKPKEIERDEVRANLKAKLAEAILREDFTEAARIFKDIEGRAGFDPPL